LSNYSALLRKVIPQSFSHELGLAKPEAAVYRHVTTELAVAPADRVFINAHAPNIDGARCAGLEAILLTDSIQLVRDLTSYRVDASG
jgi:putative hydrolase of the HAD superfamily